VRSYLEYAIEEQVNADPEFHTLLVSLYLGRITALDEEELAGGRPGSSSEFQEVQEKLSLFLKSSKHYDAISLKDDPSFTVEKMPEERAYLLSRLGEHVEALTIYVEKMADLRLAEEYCANVYDADDEKCRDVYLALLQVYLEKLPTIDDATRVLREYHDRLDTSKVLDILPPSMLMEDLKDFLFASIRTINYKKRNGMVVKSIRQGQSVQATKARAAALYHLASEAKQKGDFQMGMQNFEKATKFFAQVYGDGHQVTQETKAQALFCKAGLYKNQRDMHNAANYYEQVRSSDPCRYPNN
jgi:tetratricopeptide (TPR) repeat protein